MKFIVYQCSKDPETFIVTDEAHKSKVSARLCESGGELTEVGTFDEMGKERLAFDETIARNSIESQGFYLFHAATFEPIEQRPEMPG